MTANPEFNAWLDALDAELEAWEEHRDSLPYQLHQWWDMWDHGITPEDAVIAATILLPGRNAPQPDHIAYWDGTTPCKDCGTDTMPLDHPNRAEYYMVHNAIWEQAGVGDGYLCIGCLETRLGRILTADDFTECPVNDVSIAETHYAWSYRTPRLTSRLNNRSEAA